MNKNIFTAKDMNFNDCNISQLKIIFEFNLPLITNYPKLLIKLYLNPNFNNWLKSNDINYNDSNMVLRKIINAINKRTLNEDGKLIIQEINLDDSELWKLLIDEFLYEKLKNESFDSNICKKKNNKSYRTKNKIKFKTKKKF